MKIKASAITISNSTGTKESGFRPFATFKINYSTQTHVFCICYDLVIYMNMSGEDTLALVIDTGSGLCKAGFVGDDSPRAVFPTVIGDLDTTTFIGDMAQARRETLSLRYPVEKGLITNWDDIEKIWHYTFFNELRVSPEQYSIILTESSNNTKQSRQKMAEILFEKFNVPALYIGNQSVFSLYASGRTTGIVLYSGEGCTEVVPIVECYAVQDAIISSDFAGKDITEYLKRLLVETGYHSLETKSHDIERMKRSFGYVSLDYKNECCNSKNFELDDGRCIAIDKQVYQCTEALFQPSLIGSSSMGHHTALYNSIQRCDARIRDTLYSNIILSGGNTMFPGIVTRLEAELSALAPTAHKIKVIAAPERRGSVWIGASIVGSHSTMSAKWVSKQDYNERGVEYLEEKLKNTFICESE